MKIKTGNGTIPISVALAIWSLSVAVNLPGLAVTPIEGSLRNIFPDVTNIKIQLLTMLPNVVIIPFVLLSGRLSESTHKISVIFTGICIFLLAGVLSIFTSSLDMLILLSCLLGAGCGLILPFSTGLVADIFTGKYRMRQMGIVSAIGNISLVVATFLAGFLVAGDLIRTWHRAFIVYLIPLLSLILLPWLKKMPTPDNTDKIKMHGGPAYTNHQAVAAHSYDIDEAGFPVAGLKVKSGFYVTRTLGLLFAYFTFIFIVIIPCYYLPDLKWISSEYASTIISIFYFAMFISGLGLSSVMRVLRKSTFIAAVAMIVAGFAIYIFIHGNLVMYIFASVLCGIGSGIAQPIFYMKATGLVTDKSKSTLALAYVQSANYVAISVAPAIIILLKHLLHINSAIFPFVAMGIVALIMLIVVAARSRRFVFGISSTYY